MHHQFSRTSAVQFRLLLLGSATILSVAFSPWVAQSQEPVEQQPSPILVPPAPVLAPPTPLIPPAPVTRNETSTSVNVEKKPTLTDATVVPSPYKNRTGKEKQGLIPPAPSEASTETQTADAPEEPWTISITPMEKKGHQSLVSNYREVYNAIPYRRSEYLANPSYRHDLTVEVLFGKMRNMVINRTNNPERVVNPRPRLTQPYPISKAELSSYWPLLQFSYPVPLLSPLQ